MLAVKNVFRFIKWQWNRFEMIPKLGLSSMFTTSMSIVTNKFDEVSNAFLMASFALCFAMFAALIYTVTKDQYAKFKEERNSLFDTIKNSENVKGGKNLI